MYELHGSTLRNYCVKCGAFYDVDFIANSTGVPRCPKCGGIIKPDVVLYEEGLDEEVLSGAVSAIRKADTLIIGGTSLVVYPAAGLIRYFRGRHLVVINMQPTGAGGCLLHPAGKYRRHGPAAPCWWKLPRCGGRADLRRRWHSMGGGRAACTETAAALLPLLEFPAGPSAGSGRALRPLESLAPCFLLCTGCAPVRTAPVWVPLEDRAQLALSAGKGLCRAGQPPRRRQSCTGALSAERNGIT